MPRVAKQPVFKRPRSKFWQIRWTSRSGGENRKSSQTEDFNEAWKQYESLRQSSGLSFIEVVDRFFREHVMKPKTLASYGTSWRAWNPFIGGMMIDQIGKPELQKFVSKRLREVKSGTIRNDLAFLSSVFTFASQLEGGPETNPVTTFSKKHLKVAEERIRWLRPDQVELLEQKVADPTRWLIVLIAMESGLRLQEILNLRVHQVNLAGHYILLEGPKVKRGKGRRVPMSKKLSSALAAHPMGAPAHWLFPSGARGLTEPRPYYDVKHWWPQAVKDAELGDFHFHDLRHHFAVWYIKRGGRQEALQKLLGHKSLAMTGKYAWFASSDAEAEFRRIDDA